MTQPFAWLYDLGWALLPSKQYAALQTEISALHSQLAAKETELQQLQSVNQAESASLQAEIKRLAEALAAKQNELDALKQRIEALETQHQSQSTRLEYQNTEGSSFQKRSAEAILRDIEKFTSWGNKDNKVEQCIAELLRDYPEMEKEIPERQAIGIEIKDQLNAIYKAASSEGANSQKAQMLHQNFIRRFRFLKEKADKQLQSGDVARKRWLDDKKRKKNGQSTQVKPRQKPVNAVSSPNIVPTKQTISSIPNTLLNALDIRGLAPAKIWSLVMDETGNKFGEDAQNLSKANCELGRWVGLLVPEKNHDLPNLKPGWHAQDELLEEIERVVQCVMEANVGVLGLTVQQTPLSTGERWAAGILYLIDWVLRLMPLAGPTKLNVEIEKRDEFTDGMEWPALARDALRRLAIAYPQRAAQITLDIHIISKECSPFNGYADALAFTWGSPADASKERLNATQLLGTCFLEGDTAQILQAWEWLDRGITIRAEDWSQLLAQPDAHVIGGLTATILQRLGEACQQDTNLWRNFVNETRQHLDTKAIKLAVLGKQIYWLESYQPADEKIPPRLRLLWLTARLANANHLGETEKDWMSEMQALSAQLMDEDAPLVCWADLHLAVNVTNRYNFSQASQCLSRWFEVPRSVPGLRYWGQAASSLGQHAAFNNQPEKARPFFDAALEAFACLSDEEQRHRDTIQTATYRAILEIDHGDEASARAGVSLVLGDMDEAIVGLATSNGESTKYKHHLLLRWLVAQGNPTDRQAYLKQREHWQSGYGHPWQLIQLYRGLLLQETDKATALELAREGWAIAMTEEQGPTVRLIGACCRAVACAWGDVWPDSEAVLLELTQQLPLAEPYIAKLRTYIGSPINNPMEMLSHVLPFNFH